MLGWAEIEQDLGSVSDVMAKADTNGDGVIDYDEFVAMMTKFVTGASSTGAPKKLDVSSYSKEQLEAYIRPVS